jgi:hypothetical protein
VTNNATVGGTLGVTGDTTLSTVTTTGLATLNSASVTNNATVGGTLGVTGNTTLSTVTTTGQATLNSVSVTNNATIGGTLAVTGNTTLSTVTTTGQATLNSAVIQNGLSMNNSRITNVANAVADSDAVNFGQLKAWSGFDTTRLDRMDSRMDGMQNQINTNKAAIAGVTAATNLPGLSANQRYNFGVGYGNFANYNGMAVGGHARVTDNVVLKVSGSAASGIYSGGAGMSIGF